MGEITTKRLKKQNQLIINNMGQSINIEFSIENFDIIISFNGIKISFSNLFIFHKLNFEVLSISDDLNKVQITADLSEMILITSTFLSVLSLMTAIGSSLLAQIIPIMYWIIFEGQMINKYVNHNIQFEQKEFFKQMVIFHLIKSIGLVTSILESRGSESMNLLSKILASLTIYFDLGLNDWFNIISGKSNLFEEPTFKTTSALIVLNWVYEGLSIKNPIKAEALEFNSNSLAIYHTILLLYTGFMYLAI